jgi:hypothetical protein
MIEKLEVKSSIRSQSLPARSTSCFLISEEFSRTNGFQVGRLFFRKQPALYHESFSVGYFQRKTGSSSRGNVEGKVGMFPIFELVARHKKIAPVDVTEPNIGSTDLEIAFGKTHGTGTIAAAAALVKHQFAVDLFDLFDQGLCLFGCIYSLVGHSFNRWLLNL